MIAISRPRVVATALVLLAVINGWLLIRDQQGRHAEHVRHDMVEAGKQGAVNLTTIDHQHVDDDINRILDSSTGEFRDDFEKRAAPFADAARKAQSTSVGTVVDAGLESENGGEGVVLVAMTVMTSNRGVPEQQPKGWRVRVTVTKSDGVFKTSRVEFVP